jgi:predicted ATPase
MNFSFVVWGASLVVLIIGEAGIGKSRLVQRFHEQIAGTPHTWVEAAAGAFYQNTPFYPVTELLGELLAWRGLSGPDAVARVARHAAISGPLREWTPEIGTRWRGEMDSNFRFRS